MRPQTFTPPAQDTGVPDEQLEKLQSLEPSQRSKHCAPIEHDTSLQWVASVQSTSQWLPPAMPVWHATAHVSAFAQSTLHVAAATHVAWQLPAPRQSNPHVLSLPQLKSQLLAALHTTSH